MKKLVILVFAILFIIGEAWAGDCERVEFKVGDFVESSPQYFKNMGKYFRGTVIGIDKRETQYDLIHLCIDGEEDAYSAFWLVKQKSYIRKQIDAGPHNVKITIKDFGIAFEWIENGLHRQLWCYDDGKHYNITIMKERVDGLVDWKADNSYWDSDAIVNSNPWRQ